MSRTRSDYRPDSRSVIPAAAPLVVGVTPFGFPNPRLVIALCRAGALGVLDVGSDVPLACASLAEIGRRSSGEFGIRIPARSAFSPDLAPERASTVVLESVQDLPRWRHKQVWIEVTSLDEARAALDAGATGVIAKGCESGGRIGESASFILIQQLASELDAPILAQGGIGLHTAGAAIIGGACGVVLDAQLALVRESELPDAVRAAVSAMDGSETTVVGGHRVYTRPDLPVAQLEHASADEVSARLGARDLHRDLLPVGQDGAIARSLAARFKTAGGVVQALRAAIPAHIEAARRLDPLAPRASFAQDHGLEFPIAQGPMTRVSDRAAFACAVAEGGGLPFLALALMSGPEVRALLEETVARIGTRSWGVGILGFVPPEIREEQLKVVREFRPPVALIAGGRPTQARTLEQDGIATYLHVPSPGLLARFLKDGARRFVFEGRECGGHVGPRTSFALWEAQIEELLRFDALSEVSVLFAGGIHDARSAAMVATLASPLAERGARVGVLMGTAYVFTLEAVEGGAIQPFFQRAVCEGHTTVLLETSPGHSVRALDTPFIAQFHDTKRRLQETGATTQEVWAQLEELNLGRLRIASKALRRDAEGLRNVEADEAYRDGMFMIGDVAMLRGAPTRIAALHRDVSEGSVAWLHAQLGEEPQAVPTEPLDIAVIGMGACFPGAADVDGFWSNVVHGVDSIGEVPAERWKISDYYDPRGVDKLAGVKTPSKWGGFLPEIPFDALAYGIPPRSLSSIEPTQLLALEVARRALADAGYADREFDRSRVSVIFGAEAGTDLSSAYGLRSLFTQYCGEMPEALDKVLPKLTEDSFPGMLTNVISGRIANRLDLGGSNFTVDAACASGLAALDQACKELVSGESDMVLCGAADLHNGINDYLLFSSVHALSPNGRCRTFDADADGIVLGEGVACVALKRRADAERDGDRIYSVISGFGGSSDGRCLGLTAPRPEGQKRALERAYRQAGISPADVGLLEAHGTGTVVGDRTELEAVTDLYRKAGAQPGSCAIGSVKSQIGHTKCAAGLAGMIKASLALHTGVRPPTLHIRQPNEAYKSETSPFHFSVAPRPWLGENRRAAVSAFGFGGSNFHLVLSAYEGDDTPSRGLRHWPVELVLIRGADAEAARAEIARVERLLDRHDAAGQPWRLRDLAFTVSTSSSAPVQVAIVAEGLAELRTKLAAARSLEVSDGVHVRNNSSGKLAFLFPGQGSQRPGMLADLFAAFPQLQHLLELGEPWLDVLYPPAVFTAADRSAQQKALTDTRMAQPTLGLVDLAMAELLTQLGVQPDALAGHSYGELVALCVAGAFGERELIELSSERAHAILAAAGDDPGSMAAVEASAGEVESALAGIADVVLANDNAPRQIVISGPTAAIERAVEKLQASSLSASRIPVACAFHSPVVQGAAERLAKRLSEIDVADLELPVWSNTSGRLYPTEAPAVAELLAQQVARPVRFREEIEAMYADGVRIFVEAGPGRVLTNLVKKILGARPHVAVNCDTPGEPGLPSLLRAVAQLAVSGVELSMQALYGERECRRIEERDLAALRPHFRVDGYTVRTSDGNVIQGALQPADTLTPVTLAPQAAAAPVAAAGEREATVQTYLRGMRELVLAQREVMLSYLGTPVPAFDTSATAWRESAPAAEIAATTSRPALAAAAPPPPAAAPAQVLSGDALMQAVLGIVSERTGYPGEMLEPDLDLEADLSIDSIKRMEILAELTERVQLPAAKGAEVDEGVIEELARLKTLRQIVAWIDARTGASGAPAEPAPAPDARKTEPAPVAAQALEPDLQPTTEAAVHLPERALRYRFELVPLDAPAQSDTALAGRIVSFSGGAHELRRALAEAIHAAGGSAREWKPGLELGESDAMVHLAALPSEDRSASLPRLFSELRETAMRGCPAILVATGLGGSFGLDGASLVQAEAWAGAAGVAGLVRTFAREFPEQKVRAVDLDLKDDPRRLARQLVSELALADAAVEVGYAGGRRQSLRLAAAALRPSDAAPRLLDADSVVLVTGGARGIGARSSIALAREFGCHIELVGRSPLPDADEPADIAAALDAPALRKALIARGERKPAAIEAECARIQAAREIRTALAGLTAHAASVTYHAIDARDAEALGGLVQDVYARRGRLDAVIHAAGILEDKLIRDKTFESFQRVFDTKVASLQTLARALRPDLRFLVCFGSIAGALGNRGQVDYAAANAALALHSRRLNGSLGGRVVTIAWGPWAGGGMVTPELEREYQRRGMGLIQPDDGVLCLLEELRSGNPEDAEVVVMRAEA